ncbi:MAG TPA: sigma-70 family RNA polymerase sigma factor [Pseudonocardiaceae bacterium]|nr:sigma-70 family RNA polymerase sigma factor [Pseudonocardiaceae bacterium]
MVATAQRGELHGWTELVRELKPTIHAVTARHQLANQDAEDVMQAVWLRLLDQLGDIREPRALPRWVSVTATNECMDLFRKRRRVVLVGSWIDETWIEEPPPLVDCGEEVIASERSRALREAMGNLPHTQRRLLLLLLEEPAPSYTEISCRLRMPIGSIGPTRARAINQLRQSRILTAWHDPIDNARV